MVAHKLVLRALLVCGWFAWTAVPATSQTLDSLGGAFGGLVKTVTDPAKPTAPAAATPGAAASTNKLSDTATAPVAKGPVALVEEVSGVAGVEVMDGVNDGQTLSLGSGRVVLSHTDGCLTERIVGGSVTVKVGGSLVTGGKSQSERAPGCAAPVKTILTADAREVGGTVARATPFQGAVWRDRVVKGPRPTFGWTGKGAVEISVTLADSAPPKTIWTGKATAGRLDYPANAPALTPGARYFVEISGGGDRQGALFSVDPNLDTGAGLAARLVRLESGGLTRETMVASTKPLTTTP